MEKLTNAEILCLITLLNDRLDLEAARGVLPADVIVRHPESHTSDGAAIHATLLLKKVLREGVDRGIVRVPNCFKGEF